MAPLPIVRPVSGEPTRCLVLQNCDWEEHPAEAVLGVTLNKKVSESVAPSCCPSRLARNADEQRLVGS